MTTLFIADDDILSLNRITGLTDWSQHGYEIIGQAMNGNDCLILVEQLHPDILILDIDMPDKNGVEVAEALKRKSCDVKLLILSNYDNFAFVRDTMKNGAYDYLLKHQIQQDLLLEKLNEMRSLIEKEGTQKARISYLTDIGSREFFKYCLETTTINIANLDSQYLPEAQLTLTRANVLAVMQITNFILVTHFSQLDREKLIHSIQNLATNIFSSLKNGVIVHRSYGQFSLLFRYEKEASSQKILEQTNSHMRLLSTNIQKLFGLTTLWQISDITHSPVRFRNCYELAVKQLEQQCIPLGKSSLPLQKSASLKIDLMTEKAFTDALAIGDMDKTAELLNVIFVEYSEENGLLPQTLIEQIISIGVRFQESFHAELLKNYDTRLQTLDYSKMDRFETSAFLLEYFRKMIHHSMTKELLQYAPLIKQTILFVREHYSREVSLPLLAEQLGVSVAHLSRVFKKEVGISLIDYLTDYRIQRAKQLLQNSQLDLKEIAEQTGFNGYNYFLRVYKERTGNTPSQDRSTNAAHLVLQEMQD